MELFKISGGMCVFLFYEADILLVNEQVVTGVNALRRNKPGG